MWLASSIVVELGQSGQNEKYVGSGNDLVTVVGYVPQNNMFKS